MPDGVTGHFRAGIGRRGRKLSADWATLFESYRRSFPALADRFDLIQSGGPPDAWEAGLPVFPADAAGIASRDASASVENVLAQSMPWLLGGAADLAPSTKTRLTAPEAGDFEASHYGGRNLHFGIREHAMGAILNGLALNRLRPFGATFLIFSDYMKPAIRLAALMRLPVILIFTHDSIGLGEDGPTHQPVEQLLGLRAIPGLILLRPADANEVTAAWRVIVGLAHHPVCLVLSRQKLPTFDRSVYAPADGLARGAYVMADGDGPGGGAAAAQLPAVILIGTGSEVALCAAARDQLAKAGIAARLVSMPSWELFEAQDQAYRDLVLPPAVTARVSVEAGAVLGWDRYVGQNGARIGMTSFGASAPIKDLLVHFGFTVQAVVAAAHDQIARQHHSGQG